MTWPFPTKSIVKTSKWDKNRVDICCCVIFIWDGSRKPHALYAIHFTSPTKYLQRLYLAVGRQTPTFRTSFESIIIGKECSANSPVIFICSTYIHCRPSDTINNNRRLFTIIIL